jgi:hypothetical protein
MLLLLTNALLFYTNKNDIIYLFKRYKILIKCYRISTSHTYMQKKYTLIVDCQYNYNVFVRLMVLLKDFFGSIPNIFFKGFFLV